MTAPGPITADDLLAEADRLPLPTLAELVADAERLTEELCAVLQSAADPFSVPEIEVWPGLRHADLLVAEAIHGAKVARANLAVLAAITQLPARQDPRIATTGGPGPNEPSPRCHGCQSCLADDDQDRPWPPAGEGPTPGPAAAVAAAASESACAGGLDALGAGDGFSLPRPPELEFGPMRAAVARIRDGRSAEVLPPNFPGSPPGPPPKPDPKPQP